MHFTLADFKNIKARLMMDKAAGAAHRTCDHLFLNLGDFGSETKQIFCKFIFLW